jgi:hypothetical protein
MSSTQDKTPLKTRTAWNHLQTIQRAKETVNSWPEWKRDRVVFRDRTDLVALDTSVDSEALRKRSA